MVRSFSRFAATLLALGVCQALISTSADAQAPKRNEIRIPPAATGEEQTRQHNLWVLEVYTKPMRLISVELTDPKTGEKKLEYIRYITYRAVHRKARERTEPNTP